MRFKLDELELRLHNFQLLYMLEDTWLKCDIKKVSSEGNQVYYNRVRVIRFEMYDVVCMDKESFEFFKNDGVEGVE